MLMEKGGAMFGWSYFISTERLCRFDYALPVYKIAIEREGGIWAKGKIDYSYAIGIQRDMEKSNLAQSLGWVIIRRTPSELCTSKTLKLIKSVIALRG